MLTALLTVSAGLWFIALLMPWRSWSSKPSLESAAWNLALDNGAQITALIPARNEAAILTSTLPALQAQSKNLKIILVDDRSEDDTANVARQFDTGNLTIISGTETPEGWVGKPWALEQGRRLVQTELTLLLDADIELQPGILNAAVKLMHEHEIPMVSLMTQPRMLCFWEKLLMPAFVFFFKQVYPFRIANSESRLVAAAVGEFILIRTDLLNEIGGFSSLKGALIDDCTLARIVKDAGHRTWLGLTRSARSLRNNDTLADIWNIVARTAFTQLRYSLSLLVVCTLIMILVFWAPVIGLFSSNEKHMLLAASAFTMMILNYLPTLLYYGRKPFWALALPVIGTLYLAMTWTSALRYWHGTRSQWKGRIYHTNSSK